MERGGGVCTQARNNDDFVAKNRHKKTLVYKRGFKIAPKILYRRWTSNSNHIKQPVTSQISPLLFGLHIVLWFNFMLGLNFIFHALFWGVVIYDNDFSTKGNKI